MSEMHWYRFPRFGRTRIWVHDKTELPRALELYRPNRWLGKLVRILASYGPSLLWVKQERSSQIINELTNISEQIKSIVPIPNLIININSGTPGPHQKMTAQISDNKKIIAYAKIGSNEMSNLLIQNERFALGHDMLKSFSMAIVPNEIKNSFHAVNGDILVQSVPDIPLFQKNNQISNAEVITLSEMIPSQPIITDLKNILKKHDDIKSCTLSKTLCYLEEKFEEKGVLTGFSHGDFAPWNMSSHYNENIYIFDWEYFDENAPVLTDLLHRIYMPARLVQRIDPYQSLLMLRNVWKDVKFSNLIKLCGVSKDESIAYIALYLYRQAVREVSDDGLIPEYIEQTLNIILSESKISDHRKKVIVSAYACEPHKGSEPGVGWNWATEISCNYEAWVITRRNNRRAIETYIKEKECANLFFVYADLPRYLSFWKKGGRGVRLYYYLWQFFACRKVYKINKYINFDIGHHITFVNDWIWTFFCLLNIPYIWGPIGSNGHIPLHLLPNNKAKLHHAARYCLQAVVRWVDPLYWISLMRAKIIITTNQTVSKQYPLCWFFKNKGVIELAIGMTPTYKVKRELSPDREFIILFAGQYLSIKCAHIAIQAFSLFNKEWPYTKLIMIGKGPEEGHLKHLVKKLGITEKVEFSGWMAKDKVIETMNQSDVFLYPSLESAGMVVLEAMACELPVVCVNYGGPGQMVTSQTGRAVELEGGDNINGKLASRLKELAMDHELCRELGQNGRERVEEKYSWKNKGLFVNKLYNGILGD